jgi:hypothetical protein
MGAARVRGAVDAIRQWDGGRQIFSEAAALSSCAMWGGAPARGFLTVDLESSAPAGSRMLTALVAVLRTIGLLYVN